MLCGVEGDELVPLLLPVVAGVPQVGQLLAGGLDDAPHVLLLQDLVLAQAGFQLKEERQQTR